MNVISRSLTHRTYGRTTIAALSLFTSAACATNPAEPMASTFANPLSTEQLLSDSSVSVFAEALEQSGVLNGLDSRMKYTMFVPADSALAAEGSKYLLETVLVAEGNEQRLQQVLSYHIVEGEVGFETRTVPTIDGSCLDLAVDGDKISVGLESQVLSSEIKGNFTIYQVDRMVSQRWDDARLCDPRS